MGVNNLYKNTFNTFKKKKFQLFAIGIIILLSSLLYTTMFYAIDSLRGPLEVFIEETNQEDFSIDMINGLTTYDIENLDSKYKNQIENILTLSLTDIKKYNEELYKNIITSRVEAIEGFNNNFNLELRQSKAIDFKNKKNQSNKITLYKDNKVINKAYFEKGNAPVKDTDIAIVSQYAKANDIEIGDEIAINNNTYTVTGFVLFSDNNMTLDIETFIIDNSKITLGLVNDKVYEELKGIESIYLAAEFKDKSLENKKLSESIELLDKEFDFISATTMTENQMRSGGIYEELKGGQAMTTGISITISSIAVLVILIITSKIVQSQRTQIGVLKSIGYTKNEILKPYILLLTLISLPMLLIGYVLGIISAGYMKEFYRVFYLIPNGPVKTNLTVLFMAIVVPLVVIIGLSAILINKMLSKRAIDLMKVSKEFKVNKLNKIVDKLLKNAKAQTKFKYSFILSNSSKFIVFFLGVLFSAMLIIMALMMGDFFDKMTLDYYNSVEYIYEGHVDLAKEYPELNNEEERFISLPNGFYKGENISIVGLDSNNKLHKIYNKKDKDITNDLESGAIINSTFALTHNVEKDDEVELEINNKKYKFTVIDITSDYNGDKIYINRKELSKIVMKDLDFLDIEEHEFYNGVYSKHALNKSDYMVVINKEDILEQSKMLQQFSIIAIYYMIAVAISIAVLILSILSTMTIEDNYYSISLLKVMGYSKKEVNAMLLESYFIYSIISYLISVPITAISFNYGIKYLAQKFGVVIPIELTIWKVLIGLVIIIAIFLIGSFAAKRKIDKISLQEVLKEYRE